MIVDGGAIYQSCMSRTFAHLTTIGSMMVAVLLFNQIIPEELRQVVGFSPSHSNGILLFYRQ